ncbi:MAG TPA: hypothetical protein VKV26_24820 [Dehalococcoidia bacterium]|nr:hypothetical protein [Dehalococcoidia bacterium]
MNMTGVWNRRGAVRGWRTAIGVALLSAAVLAVAVPHVRAAGFGGGWAVSRGAALVITYNDTACADPSYQTIIDDAAAQWNATDSPAAFVRTDSTDTATVQLFVCTGFDDGPDGDYWGVTELYDGAGNDCLACSYAHAKVFLNRSELDAETVEVRLKTATHEFGHVLGLAHPLKTDHTPQIMRQGWNGYDAPQAQDVANLNALYPGWADGTPKPAEATTFQTLPALAPVAPARMPAPVSGADGGELGR